MPTGRVKVFDASRKFGFLQPVEGGEEVFVHGSHVEGDEGLRAGDLVEYELAEDGRKPEARTVRVTRQAPEDTPAGRMVAGPPPTWDQLEEIDRHTRHPRRRRR